MNFKDHFSDASAQYAEFRPTYPENLFAWLSSQCRETNTAWDCATGSGQAAAGLAPHFGKVLATDASAEQIAHASAPRNVIFRVAPAEASGLEDHSMDLVTVAQAAHWFDLPAFYTEVHRVLKPGGLIMLFGYGRLELPGTMDAIFQRFYEDDIGAFWPPERKLIDDKYRSLAFPFNETSAPDFHIEVEWDLPRLMAYLSTWSAIKRYCQHNETNPIFQLEQSLSPLWGSPQAAKRLKWPLFFRIGRV